MAKQTLLGYVRANVQLPGENFIQQYGKLTEKDKKDLLRWAHEEMTVLNIEHDAPAK